MSDQLIPIQLRYSATHYCKYCDARVNQDNNFEQELNKLLDFFTEPGEKYLKDLERDIITAHQSSLEEAVRLAYEKGRKEKINYRGMTLEQKREYWKLNKRRLRATLTKDQGEK